MDDDPDYRHLPTWLLSQAAQRSNRLLHDRLAAAGSSGYEYRVLSTLAALGSVTQAELGRAAMLDPRDVTVTVRSLLESGVVARLRSPADARVQIVALTAGGRRRHRQLRGLMEEIQEEVFAALSASARERLNRDLARLSDQSREPSREPGT